MGTKLLWLAIAGALGTLSRYWLSGFVQRHAESAFPWGNLAVNITGCFLFGLVWSVAENRLSISGEMRSIILIGFMGAFTTFSSFAYETSSLIRDAEWLLAATNVLAQNAFGILFLFIGLWLGRVL